MKLHSRCYYHPRTSSVITDRNLLDTDTLTGLKSLLPEDRRYDLKYVTVCLEDGLAGEVDRESFVAALEVFGQIRDSGVAPSDILRELKKKAATLAPAVKAEDLAGPGQIASVAKPRRKTYRKSKKQRETKARR